METKNEQFAENIIKEIKKAEQTPLKNDEENAINLIFKPIHLLHLLLLWELKRGLHVLKMPKYMQVTCSDKLVKMGYLKKAKRLSKPSLTNKRLSKYINEMFIAFDMVAKVNTIEVVQMVNSNIFLFGRVVTEGNKNELLKSRKFDLATDDYIQKSLWIYREANKKYEDRKNRDFLGRVK